MPAKPFSVYVPQAKIDRLKQKLEQVDLPDEIPGAGWSRGPPLSEMKRLIEAWRSFDWRVAEKNINEQPNFTTSVDVAGFGVLDVHFLHEENSDPKAIPLLFVHGWPGSFLEVLKLKEFLTRASTSEPRFHLVAPSLPNFGFSSGVTKPGFGLAQYAETCHKLMLSLGYTRYATQAGDWGYWITRAIGFRYPDHCVASHYNMVFAKAPRWTRQPLLALQHALSPYSQFERQGQERTRWFTTTSRGYNILQSTKPQTLGYALADSPVGLLAWLWEKLQEWSDDYPWTDQELLGFVSVYWFSTAGPAAPQRIYYEVSNEQNPRLTYDAMLEYLPRVKIGLTYNPKEIEIFPRTYGRTLGNVVYEVENEHGGHFYAHEHPELLVRDLRRMFGEDINAFDI
jgi:pimeloyl-ACP methyl ester carboxylesterase